MTALIRELLDFARPRAPHKAPVDITKLVQRICELVSTIARKANVTLVPPPDAPEADPLRVEADDGQLAQVLTNLIVNAIQATPAHGTVAIEARDVEKAAPKFVGTQERVDLDSQRSRAPSKWMAIEVRDTGSGMDETTRARVFEPFYTTKDVGEGTGLGLSIAWGIVREHGGWIDVASTPGEGSSFTVYLPRA